MTVPSRGIAVACEAVKRAPRLKVFEPIQLTNGARVLRGHMLNVSITGALVHADASLRAGDIVTIRLRDTDLVARIVRVAGSRLGMMFARPISETMLATLIA